MGPALLPGIMFVARILEAIDDLVSPMYSENSHPHVHTGLASIHVGRAKGVGCVGRTRALHATAGDLLSTSR